MLKILNPIILLSILFILPGCFQPKEPEIPTNPSETSDDTVRPILPDPDQEENRIVWQKPEEVVKLLGDISNKTIADIGAGTGYFTFRFALKAQKVIAIDIDPTMIQILESFRNRLPEEIYHRIEPRMALPNDPQLKEGEADIVVIINTIGYIDNRQAYLKTLQKGLAEDGEIMILDFKTKNIPINAPPMKDRVPLGTLEKELTESGYTILSSDDRTLDYQYIIRARKK